jgi:hypothetical protein
VRKRAQATQAMPIASPPNQTRLMSYPVVNATDTWMLHHAAPFAAVRWTNVYDPATLVFFGDVIGGPLASVFGPAIIGRPTATTVTLALYTILKASRGSGAAR